MNAPIGRLQPTAGQLALAAALADGGTERAARITYVDAAA